jgi:hypothetical protein
MPPIHSFHIFFSFFLTLNLVNAVTVYYQPGQSPLATGTGTAAGANYTGAAAYDPTILTPPPIPSPLNTQFSIQLQNGGTPNVSIQQPGSFMGFSIEMSVVNQVGPLLALYTPIFIRYANPVLSWKKCFGNPSSVPQLDGQYCSAGWQRHGPSWWKHPRNGTACGQHT